MNQDDMEVVCIDLQAEIPADLHDDQTYMYLLAMAASGRVKAIVGGLRMMEVLAC